MRALLTSVAAVIAVFPGAVVLGGYLPDLPTVGRHGLYLTIYLPGILVGSLVSLGLALLALRLGGGRFTKLLAAGTGAIFFATIVANVALWSTAAANGASYSPLASAPTSWRAPDRRVVFTTTADGIEAF